MSRMPKELSPPPLTPSADPDSSPSETSEKSQTSQRSRKSRKGRKSARTSSRGRSRSADKAGKRRDTTPKRKVARSDRSQSKRKSTPTSKSQKSVSSAGEVVQLEKGRKVVLTIGGCCHQCCCSCAYESPGRRFGQEESSSRMSGFSDLARHLRKGEAMKLYPLRSSGKNAINWYEDTLVLTPDRDEQWSGKADREPRGWSGFLISKTAEYVAIAGYTTMLLLLLNEFEK